MTTHQRGEPAIPLPALRDRIEIAFARWGGIVYRFRWVAIVAMAAVTVALASGAAHLRFEMSTDAYLDPGDPARITYDAFRREFDNDDTLLLILHSEEVFSFGFLEKLRKLHRDLEREIPLLDEVTSLINARVTRGSREELIVEDLLEEWPRSRAELELVAARARANPVYTNTLLSEDARYTTVTISITPQGDRAEGDILGGFDGEVPESGGDASKGVGLPPILQDQQLASVMQSLFAVVDRYRSEDFPIYITGNPEMTYALTATSRSDMTRFAGLTNVIIALLLLLLFRRVSGVLLPLLVVTLPLAATLGIMGFAGLPLTPSTQQLPSFLIAVCVGDAVHLLTIFYRRLDGGSGREDAIAHALGHSGLAVVMTSLTTAGALGSFAFADLTPIAGLGIAAPTGVMLALVYALTLLPALLGVLPIRPRWLAKTPAGPTRIDRILVGIGDFSTSRPWLVVACWSALVAVAIFGAARLELAHRPLEWFPEDYPTRVAAEVANREMKGLMPLELLVDSGVENGLYEPELMRRVDQIQSFARSVEVNGVVAGQAISLADILKETNRALNENDPAYYAIPRERELIAQELLLFENSGSDDLEELVDTRFRKARVTLLITYDDGFRYLDFVREIEKGSRAIAGDWAELESTGLVKLWVRTIAAMVSSTAKSYSIALLVIAPLMILLIGDLRVGLLSLIPNLAPIVMGMGLMHWVGIHFDMFTMLIGTIAIGMAVDDTIHFMHGFYRYTRRGADPPTAVRETLLSTGRALLITSLALSTGFFVQVFGTMISVRNCGLITGFTILAALLADLILSPALVTLAARFSQRRAQRRDSPAVQT